MRFAIDATELGTWDFDPKTNKFSSNVRLKEWFGLAPDAEIDLSTAISVIIPEDRERVSAAINKALDYRSGGRYDIEYTILNADNERRIVRAKGKTWFNEDKEAYRFNGTLQDVTDRTVTQKKLEKVAETLGRQFNERTQELQRSNQDLMQFAHVTSHDLKEPLRKIKIFTDRLEHECGSMLTRKGKEYLDKVHTSTDRILTMVEGILTYSSVSADNQITEQVNLNRLIKEAEADLELLIQQTSATIHAEPLPK